MRKADNAGSMLDAIRAASGLVVQVLAPEVETLFGAVGARSGFSDVNGLFLDLGGGSVQMTYMDSAVDGYEIAAARTGESLPFGAAKLIKVLEGDKKDAKAATSTLQAGMRDAFMKLQHRFPKLASIESDSEHRGLDIYLCGGGFRGYGSMLMHNDPVHPYPIPAVGAYTVSGSFFKDVKKMRKVNKEYDSKIFGMSKRRRQQFPAIATVVEALIAAVPKIHTVTFCSGGNREGALIMRLPKEVRESKPLELLHQRGDEASDAALQSVITIIMSAVPPDFDMSQISTVFTLGLGHLFIGKIWARAGEPSEANAAFEIHQAITRDPSVPGLTHLARAILGLTLCARWGSTLGPIDRQLHKSLRELTYQESPEVNFWADYFGAIASVLVMLCPAEPKSPGEMEKLVKFSARSTHGKNKPKIELNILVSANATRGIDIQDVADAFQDIGKYKKDAMTVDRKVETIVLEMQQ